MNASGGLIGAEADGLVALPWPLRVGERVIRACGCVYEVQRPPAADAGVMLVWAHACDAHNVWRAG